jgi:hypothetical protein
MRRLVHILFNALTVLSLLSCVGSVGIWIRSYWRIDAYFSQVVTGTVHDNATVSRLAFTSTGRLRLSEIREESRRHSFSGPPWEPRRRAEWVHEPGRANFSRSPQYDETGAHRYAFAGFELVLPTTAEPDRSARFYYSQRPRVLTVPLAAVAAAAGVVPVWRFVRWYRVRARKRCGHCPACGYDLRATPDRCPECGAVVGESSES